MKVKILPIGQNEDKKSSCDETGCSVSVTRYVRDVETLGSIPSTPTPSPASLVMYQ